MFERFEACSWEGVRRQKRAPVSRMMIAKEPRTIYLSFVGEVYWS